MFDDIINGTTKTITGSAGETITLAESRWASAVALLLGVVGGSKLARHNMINGNGPMLGIIG